MKTAEEKAIAIIDGKFLGAWASREKMYEVLKEFEQEIRADQHEKTKRNCADAVADLDEVCETPNGGIAICPETAYDACMNVKAV